VQRWLKSILGKGKTAQQPTPALPKAMVKTLYAAA